MKKLSFQPRRWCRVSVPLIGLFLATCGAWGELTSWSGAAVLGLAQGPIERVPGGEGAKQGVVSGKNYLNAHEPEGIRIAAESVLTHGAENFARLPPKPAASAEVEVPSFIEFSKRVGKEQALASSTASTLPGDRETAADLKEAGVADGKLPRDSIVSVGSGGSAVSTVATLFPRPYQGTFSDTRLLLFFPINLSDGGSLSGGKYLVPVYEASGFQPPLTERARSSATYRTLP